MLAKRMKSSHPGSRNVHHYKASSTHTLLDPQALCSTKKSGYNHAATIRGTTTISCCGEIFGALKSHVIVASRNLTPKRQLSNGILSWPKFRVKYSNSDRSHATVLLDTLSIPTHMLTPLSRNEFAAEPQRIHSRVDGTTGTPRPRSCAAPQAGWQKGKEVIRLDQALKTNMNIQKLPIDPHSGKEIPLPNHHFNLAKGNES